MGKKLDECRLVVMALCTSSPTPLSPMLKHSVTDAIICFSLCFSPSFVTQLKSTLCSDGILQSVQNLAESWQEQSSVM